MGNNKWLAVGLALVASAVLIAAGCSSSSEETAGPGAAGGSGGDGGSGATAGSGGSGGEAGSGGMNGGGGSGGTGHLDPELVRVHTHEIELGINQDAPGGASRVRWYGGLLPFVQGDAVTGAVIETVAIEIDGDERPVSAPELEGSPMGSLPTAQRTVYGGLTGTSVEIDRCAQSGPAVHRIPSDVIVRMTGSSDQGAWAAEAPVEPPDSMWTCHSGRSAIARGLVEVWDTPQLTWIDLSAHAQLTETMALDAIVVQSLVVEAEGLSDSYTALGPGGTPGQGGPPYETVSVFAQDDGDLSMVLCPDMGGTPLVYLTYQGTADGQPFAGTAPAGACSRYQGS